MVEKPSTRLGKERVDKRNQYNVLKKRYHCRRVIYHNLLSPQTIEKLSVNGLFECLCRLFVKYVRTTAVSTTILPYSIVQLVRFLRLFRTYSVGERTDENTERFTFFPITAFFWLSLITFYR